VRDLRTLIGFAIKLPSFPPVCADAGAFDIPSPATGVTLRVIATSGMGWDHVSVSTRKRCPNWPEMSRIKALFFHDHECAMQVHVPVADHINNHPYCLHLWRPHDVEIPRPPGEFVGLPELTQEQVRMASPEERAAMRLEGLARFEARTRQEA